MAIVNDYTSGTVSISAGGTTLTGVGTAWKTAGIRAGDTFMNSGLVVVVTADATSETSLTIEAWPGSALSGASYRIRFQPDGSRYSAAARELVEMLANGNVEALAGLTGSSGDIPYFTGAHTMDAIAGVEGSILGYSDGAPVWADPIGYAEGTFVPFVSFGAVGGVAGIDGQTYSQQYGYYTRIGNLVIARFRVSFSNKGTSTGNANIAGLPLTIATVDGSCAGSAIISYYTGMSLPSAAIIGFASGETAVQLRSQSTSTTSNLTDSNFTNTSTLIGTIIYQAAAE